jgi:hypothetical protein
VLEITDLASWHRLAGDEKVETILALAPPRSERIVEIGSGSGAVLEGLDRRGFGSQYWACEPTPHLHDAIPEKNIRRLVATSSEPFDRAFLGEPVFDLGILTHVVEHLRTPAVLLATAMERCRYVVVEVPIEDNILGKARTEVRRLAGRRRIDNVSGHVQFFNRRTARALVAHSGGEVLAERAYFPASGVAGRAGNAYQRTVAKTGSLFPPLGRLYYEHFAMLVRAVRYDDWQGHYIPPQ